RTRAAADHAGRLHDPLARRRVPGRAEFEYDLKGLVVSWRRHDGNSRMHRRANDPLHGADVCVLWGNNARSEHLDAFKNHRTGTAVLALRRIYRLGASPNRRVSISLGVFPG